MLLHLIRSGGSTQLKIKLKFWKNEAEGEFQQNSLSENLRVFHVGLWINRLCLLQKYF
jgi:hypothetical protein